MNKGTSIKVKKRAVKYLLSVIDENNLQPPYYKVNIDNSVIREKYFGKDPGRRKYYIARNYLKETGVISDADNFYYRGSKSFYYNINYCIFIHEMSKLGISPKIPDNISYTDITYIHHISLYRYYIYLLNVIKVESDKSYTDISSYILSSSLSLITSYIYLLNVIKVEIPDWVRIGKGMRAGKEMTDYDIRVATMKKYPQLRDYNLNQVQLLNSISEFNQIKFEPKITRSSKTNNVTGISIRATNPLCNFWSYEKHKEDENPLPYIGSREQYLTDYFFSGEWEEFDVTGSIPTIARFMNKGIIDLDVDPYEEMIKMLDEKYDLQATRKFFKQLFMRLFFGGTAKQIRANLNWDGKDIPLEVLDACKEVVKEYTGCTDMKNTEAFLHESCIYIDVMCVLKLDRRLNCAQVYDAFYFRKGQMPEDMKEIIINCAKEYKKRYQC